MNTRDEGIVLLTTIIMIIILTTLVLAMMQAVFLYSKASNQVEIHHERLYQLEVVADKLTKTSLDRTTLDCMLTQTNPNDVIDLLLNNQGCSLIDNQQQYYYLLDDLGLFPCLKIEKYSTHHWLVTVASAPPYQKILQIRIARRGKVIKCNHVDERQIALGMMSWRYLP